MVSETESIVKIIELEVRHQLDERLSSEFDKKSAALVAEYKTETDKFRSTIKKMGGIIAAVLGLGAITNVADLFGIPEKISKGISTQIETAIATKDPHGQYDARLKRIFGESIVNYVELSNLTKAGGPHDPERPKLSRQDAEFLLKFVLNEEVDYTLFNRIVGVFRYADDQSREIYRTRVLEVLSVGISGSEAEKKKYGHFYGNSRYAAGLINGFDSFPGSDDNNDILERLRRLLEREELPRNVRVAILEQAIKRADIGSLDHYLRALKSQDKEVRNLGGVGLATVQPDRKELSEIIDTVSKEANSWESARFLARVAQGVCDHKENENGLRQADAVLFGTIVKAFDERTEGWFWDTEFFPVFGPSGEIEREKFDIEKSNPTLWVRTGPSTRAGRRLVTIFHRNCRKATRALFQTALAQGDANVVRRLVKLLGISEGRVSRFVPGLRGGSFVALPALVARQPFEIKCQDKSTATIAAGVPMPLSISGESAGLGVAALVGADRPRGEGRWCVLSALPSAVEVNLVAAADDKQAFVVYSRWQ